MSTHIRYLAVTGAHGYIGTRLCISAAAKGWKVLALARRPPALPDCEFVEYDLAKPLAPSALSGVTAIIHLAADTRNADPDRELELAACRRLMSVANEVGSRFVYVSSQAAAADAPTGYGRTKELVEQLVLSRGGRVVRLGLVYGGVSSGLFGQLCAMVRHLPVLPIFVLPPLRVQLIHIDDAVAALLACAESDVNGPPRLEIANIRPETFTSLLRAIAKYRIRRRRIFVPVPTPLVACMLILMRAAGVRGGIDPARLSSLAKLRVMDSAAALAATGITPRALADGMHASGSARRRGLAQEGQTLIRYFARTTPASGSAKRYVRAVERFDGGNPLQLSSLVHALPQLAVLLDRRGPRTQEDSDLDRRLDVAFQIAEASVETRYFLLTKRVRWPLAIAQLVWYLALEAPCVLARPLARSLLFPSRRHGQRGNERA